MATAADTLLAAHLSANIAGLTLGTNVFDGPVRAEDEASGLMPGEAVYVTLDGGMAPLDTKGAEVIRQAAVAVRVRSKTDDYAGGRTLAEACWKAAHHAALTGYMDVGCVTSAPAYLGQLADARHEWSFNVECIYGD